MDAWQGVGAFGEVVAGGSRFLARLLRSSGAGSGSAAPAGAHLMPCPRGAFSSLRFVPLERQTPAAGEVKVRLFRTWCGWAAGGGMGWDVLQDWKCSGCCNFPSAGRTTCTYLYGGEQEGGVALWAAALELLLQRSILSWFTFLACSSLILAACYR